MYIYLKGRKEILFKFENWASSFIYVFASIHYSAHIYK
jgi:hypothetical protein